MPSDLQVSNLKDLTGSNTGLSIASDGQVTISQNNPTLTLGSNTTYPSGHVLNYHTNTYDGGSASIGGNHSSYAETSTNARFAYTPISASSKIVISYYSTHAHINANQAYYAIGHEVTASGGTATASTLVSQIVTVGGGTDTSAYFYWGIQGGYTDKLMHLMAEHSPTYTIGQKIWYSIISAGSGYHYVTNGGDLRFTAIEIKG